MLGLGLRKSFSECLIYSGLIVRPRFKLKVKIGDIATVRVMEGIRAYCKLILSATISVRSGEKVSYKE